MVVLSDGADRGRGRRHKDLEFLAARLTAHKIAAQLCHRCAKRGLGACSVSRHFDPIGIDTPKTAAVRLTRSMATKPLKKNATYDDLREVPDQFVAEIFDGDLYASPRPAVPHLNAASALLTEIRKSFHHAGPLGWVILSEPELHLRRDVLVPDLAGWRRTRMPNVPGDAYIALAPDWICEVLSASTEAIDRGKKLRIYARERVAHAWLLHPLEHWRRARRTSWRAGKWTRKAFTLPDPERERVSLAQARAICELRACGAGSRVRSQSPQATTAP
jgi:Uma2 family endonuclease